jgi:hypothetical protein
LRQGVQRLEDKGEQVEETLVIDYTVTVWVDLRIFKKVV